MNIPFHDVDAAGIAHFSKLFCYAEAAEHQALASCGMPINTEEYLWPRLSSHAEFYKPFRLHDELIINVFLTKIGGSSLFWTIELSNQHHLCATITFICARRLDTGEKASFTPLERLKLQKLIKIK